MTKVVDKVMSFEILIPTMKRFVAKKNSFYAGIQPGTQCIKYDGKYLQATDAYKTIKVKSNLIDLPSNDPFLFHVHEDKILYTSSIQFPNIERLYNLSTIGSITLTKKAIKEWKDVITDHQKNTMDQEHFKFVVDSQSLSIVTDEGVSRFYNYELNIEEFEINLNADYLKKVLTSAYELLKLSTKDYIRIEFNDKLLPIQITDDDAFQALLAPYRTQ
ncbi:hypothetical protein [Oceanobacillus kimchii]|uniref:Uncharacterized protein n=1 Tax=Oceanobacillus kimchii TaxID=746691 RepID=A0ABQ5TH42_9BACI|nr:hypothetical protein [Oceanobacillus kimchii]GLO66183.1 hypothetical protein MACH08_19670 [Oceanobacillus kimchii]